MLVNLSIENVAVIERASIDFTQGLNVLTGETGAGKSIIIDSLNAVLGERTSRDLIRTGTTRARVTALFESVSPKALAVLNEYGFSEEDGAVILQRDLTAAGKSTCRINGTPAPAAAVRAFGRMVLNIHGQHDNQQLMSPLQHIHYLDVLGGLEQELEEYYAAYRVAVDLKHRLADAEVNELERDRQIELLRYQIDELESAQLRIGERDELTERRTVIQNAERIRTAVDGARGVLSGDEEYSGVIQELRTAAQQLAEAARYMPELKAYADQMNDASYTLEDAAEGLRSAVDDEDSYPGELDDVEARLDQLYRLSLKYGSDEAEMLAFLEDAQTRLDQIENADAHRARLEEEYIAAGMHAKELALALSEKREQIGEVFVQRVTEELAYLDMPRVRLEIAHEYGNLNATGCDRIEFLISTNPGEPPKPLTKIASGGEMSRLMLAIKNVLADKDEIDTLIFDEVDTGISGRAALKVGRKLRQVAEDRQVLCVTHLAQIAAHAHAHLLIEKKVRGERTATQVRTLERDGRRQELARIMSGTDQPTELQLHSAEELLETAENA